MSGSNSLHLHDFVTYDLGSCLTLLLVKHGNIPNKTCISNHNMVLRKNEDESGDYSWCCTKLEPCERNGCKSIHKCNRHEQMIIDEHYYCFSYVDCEEIITNNLRDTTFFSRDTELTIKQIIIFISKWVIDMKRDHIARYIQAPADLFQRNLLDWSCFCREVLVDYLIQTSRRIGGQDKNIFFSQCIFGKRKYKSSNIDFNFPASSWVYTGIDKNTGEHFFVVTPYRNTAVLTHTITNFINPFTNITYDKGCFQDEHPYLPLVRFVTNYPLNVFEGEFSHELCYTSFKTVQLTSGTYHDNHFIAGYLAFVLFRKICSIQDKNYFNEFFKIICETYKDKKPEGQKFTNAYPDYEWHGINCV